MVNIVRPPDHMERVEGVLGSMGRPSRHLQATLGAASKSGRVSWDGPIPLGSLQAFWQKWGSEIVATVETLWGAVVSVISGAIGYDLDLEHDSSIAVFIWDRKGVLVCVG